MGEAGDLEEELRKMRAVEGCPGHEPREHRHEAHQHREASGDRVRGGWDPLELAAPEPEVASDLVERRLVVATVVAQLCVDDRLEVVRLQLDAGLTEVTTSGAAGRRDLGDL